MKRFVNYMKWWQQYIDERSTDCLWKGIKICMLNIVYQFNETTCVALVWSMFHKICIFDAIEQTFRHFFLFIFTCFFSLWIFSHFHMLISNINGKPTNHLFFSSILTINSVEVNTQECVAYKLDIESKMINKSHLAI